MADTIITKYSTTPGVVPTPAQLEVGELAVNLPDRKLYTKTAGGVVIELLSG